MESISSCLFWKSHPLAVSFNLLLYFCLPVYLSNTLFYPLNPTSHTQARARTHAHAHTHRHIHTHTHTHISSHPPILKDYTASPVLTRFPIRLCFADPTPTRPSGTANFILFLCLLLFLQFFFFSFLFRICSYDGNVKKCF